MFKKRILACLKFLGLLLGMLLFSAMPIVIFKIPFDKFSLTFQTLYYFLFDVLFMGILFMIYKKKIIKDWKNYFKDFRSMFELSFKYYFIGVVFMIVSNLIITFMITDAIAGNEEAVRDMIDQVPLYMLFSVSLYAPFVEELIFRHSIKEIFQSSKRDKIVKYMYIFTSGFIFAFMHVMGQITSFIDYIYILPYMSLGICFSSLYSKTDNIFSSIMMHALHNFSTIILYFMVGGIV